MRSVSDRIRHAISFEVIGVLIVIPMGALAFDLPMQDMGVVSVISAMIATLWNLVYNTLFDLGMARVLGTTAKSAVTRVVHAVLFEAGLLCVLLPFIAVYLGISLWAALAMDISFALFYMAYAFVFNWGYDRLFPLAEWQVEA